MKKLKSLFTGRIGIKQYWLAALLYVLVIIPVAIVAALLSSAIGYVVVMLSGMEPISGFVLGMVIAVVIWSILLMIASIPSYGLVVRRYHDVGLSGWVLVAITFASWILSLAFPIFTVPDDISSFSLINLIVALPFSLFSLAVLLWPGNKGVNKYGAQTTYTSIRAALLAKQPEPETPVA